ncbi:hypothetical protein BO83DRAFT_421634 [Aspergillus eucalypticola CBS 122712]|uniref:Uncharacterized protein n=1 Tax=Aspergillus eucalypticola (strain CBS 122712 / IBT 29274) TaxID=1448314 RepID=A0A317URA1_ASPEC|nr:uncharacterized protein BO83DRAFT_421634 [Aspergillus eucalypticola CBS 122712]PWY62570.1 hypothetical protein BO83DRAFT_421634 [Aspergillus eucalypticola CBS 122712]
MTSQLASTGRVTDVSGVWRAVICRLIATSAQFSRGSKWDQIVVAALLKQTLLAVPTPPAAYCMMPEFPRVLPRITWFGGMQGEKGRRRGRSMVNGENITASQDYRKWDTPRLVQHYHFYPAIVLSYLTARRHMYSIICKPSQAEPTTQSTNQPTNIP